jgi:hypothetical protein
MRILPFSSVSLAVAWWCLRKDRIKCWTATKEYGPGTDRPGRQHRQSSEFEKSFESGTFSTKHPPILFTSLGYCGGQPGFAAYLQRFATLSLSPLVLSYIIRNFVNLSN